MSYSLAFTQTLFLMLYVADKVQQKQFEFISTQQISDDLGIPPSSAASILRRLNRAGFIETREGAGGGVRLAVLPENITLLDVFLAIEQGRPLFQTSVQLGVVGSKPSKAQATIAGILLDAEEVMKDHLQTVTLKDLIAAINR